MDSQDPFAAGLRTDKAAGRPADQIEKGIRLRALQVDKLPRHIYAGALPLGQGGPNLGHPYCRLSAFFIIVSRVTFF